MRLASRHLAVAIALVMTSAPCQVSAAASTSGAPLTQPDADALARIATVAHQVCTAPTQAGSSVSGEAQLGGGATLPKIIAKLAQVSITAMVKVGGTKWTGVRQEDLAPSLAASDACAERTFIHMFDTLRMAHAGTGQPIPRPRKVKAIFHELSSRPGPPAPSIMNHGGIVTMQQSGGTNTVINPPIPHSPTGLYLNELEVGRVYGVTQDGDTLRVQRLELFDGQPPGVPLDFANFVVVCTPAANGSSGQTIGSGHQVSIYFDATCRRQLASPP